MTHTKEKKEEKKGYFSKCARSYQVHPFIITYYKRNLSHFDIILCLTLNAGTHTDVRSLLDQLESGFFICNIFLKHNP